MLSGKLGWREIRKRPGRAALTLASVVIGVASVVAVTFTNQTTRKAFDQIYRSITGRAALEVSAPVGETIDESALAKVQQTPGVLVASPVIQRRTVLYREGRRIQLLGMGVDPVRDRAVHEYKMEAGKGLSNSKDILLHAAFAKSVGVKLNDRVELLTRVGRVRTARGGAVFDRRHGDDGPGRRTLDAAARGSGVVQGSAAGRPNSNRA